MITETAGYHQGYDAAQDNTTRSLLLFPTNSRTELSSYTRARLQEKARALEANFTPITRIRAKFGRAVAGRGIFPVPVTADAEWNKAAKIFIERWASNPFLYSVDGSRDMWEDQRLDAEELGCGDGETFSAFAERDGLLMLQPLDPFEIGTPYFYRSTDYDDGVQSDAFLRPTGYSVRELPAGYSATAPGYRTVPAEQMLHLFRRRRAKQFRGLPPIYSGLNTGNDALDKLALETATEKLHSLLAVTKTAKPANKGQGLSNQLNRVLNADGTLNRIEEKMPRGAATVELDEGEALQLLNSTRPSQNFLEGMRFGCMLIALGVDLPASVVMGFVGLGGTAVRGDLEDAQNTFELRQDQLVWRKYQRIYIRRIARAMDRGELPRCRDPYFYATDWHGPAKMTVDYGRSATANIDLMKAGMMSVPRYMEERGINWQNEQDAQILWLKRAQDECAKAGVEFSRFMEATPGAVPAVAPAAAADPAEPADPPED
jgi:capsid protein